MLSRLFKKFAGVAYSNNSDEEEHRLEAMVGPPGVWKESRDFQIRFLRQMGLKTSDKVLDIGCGPLRGGLPLIKYLDKGMYVGVDIRPEVIDEAKNQIAINRLEDKAARLIVSSTFGQGCFEEERFDYVWCFQVLYHLSDELAERCFAQIAAVLDLDGVCYCNVNIDGDEGQWKEFPFLKRPLAFYQDLALKHGLKLSDMGQLKSFGYTTKVPGQFNNMLELRLMTK